MLQPGNSICAELYTSGLQSVIQGHKKSKTAAKYTQTTRCAYHQQWKVQSGICMQNYPAKYTSGWAITSICWIPIGCCLAYRYSCFSASKWLPCVSIVVTFNISQRKRFKMIQAAWLYAHFTTHASSIKQPGVLCPRRLSTSSQFFLKSWYVFYYCVQKLGRVSEDRTAQGICTIIHSRYTWHVNSTLFMWQPVSSSAGSSVDDGPLIMWLESHPYEGTKFWTCMWCNRL